MRRYEAEHLDFEPMVPLSATTIAILNITWSVILQACSRTRYTPEAGRDNSLHFFLGMVMNVNDLTTGDGEYKVDHFDVLSLEQAVLALRAAKYNLGEGRLLSAFPGVLIPGSLFRAGTGPTLL